MAFCTRAGGVLRAVNVNWNDDGWNLEANSVLNPDGWNDGNLFFSRNLLFFSCRLGGSFLLKAFFPTSQHPSDFL